MVRSLKLGQYLSHGKLERRRLIQPETVFRLQWLSHGPCQTFSAAQSRTILTEKSIIMQCKEHLTFCDNDYGSNSSRLLNHPVVSGTGFHMPDLT